MTYLASSIAPQSTHAASTKASWSHQPRIAVGVDGSTWGEAALSWAIRHTRLVHGNLFVYAAGTCDLEAISRDLYAQQGLNANAIQTVSTPETALKAASINSDLLVLGYRGDQHGPLGLGSSVLPVITDAQCDTVVVRGELKAVRGEFGRISAAVSGQDDRAVLRRAVEAANQRGSELQLIHAVPLHTTRQPSTPVDVERTLQQAREFVLQLAPKLPLSLKLVRAWAHEAVRTHARGDLLVIGYSNHYGRLSLVTSAALHLAPCPVWVVKPTNSYPIVNGGL